MGDRREFAPSMCLTWSSSLGPAPTSLSSPRRGRSWAGCRGTPSTGTTPSTSPPSPTSPTMCPASSPWVLLPETTLSGSSREGLSPLPATSTRRGDLRIISIYLSTNPDLCHLISIYLPPIRSTNIHVTALQAQLISVIG